MTDRTINTGPRDWDAETYDAVSDPAVRVGDGGARAARADAATRPSSTPAAARAGSRPSCCKRLPNGRVIAVDGSAAMIEKAKERLGSDVTYVVADLSELELAEPVDLVFSTATFHWILDHDRLFARLRAALKPGGRLVAQCGGEGNVAEYAQAIVRAAARSRASRPTSTDLDAIWNFAAPDADRRAPARRRLRRGPLLAAAEAGDARPSRSSSSAPSASARIWRSSRRSCAAPSPRRSWRRRASR